MKNIIIFATVFMLLFVITFFVISFAWMGAEYIIEHAVKFGTVDRFVACSLSFYIVTRVMRGSKKSLKEENHSNKESSNPNA